MRVEKLNYNQNLQTRNLKSKKEIGFGDLYLTFNKNYLKVIPKIEDRISDSYNVLERTELNCFNFWGGLKRIKKQLRNSPIKMVVSIDSNHNVTTVCGLEDKYAGIRRTYNLPVPKTFHVNGDSFPIAGDKDNLNNFFIKVNTAIDVLNPFFKEQNKLVNKSIRNHKTKNEQFYKELCENLNVEIDEDWIEKKKWDSLSPELKELGYKEMLSYYRK